ncbi:MAG TPA: SpoIID/LytB domain-containing protein [Smithellaceae bacterium]|nr:SpoIID/LytB domain-containing protein [Smithellaceae bacterium]
MITDEPKIKVAILQNYREAKIRLNGNYQISNGATIRGNLAAAGLAASVQLSDDAGKLCARHKEIRLTATEETTFTLFDVKIGIDFHWQRKQQQTFQGDILLCANSDSTFNLVNEISLEKYLASVISSEMSAAAPFEFLKAQAITARSWLVAMLERKTRQGITSSPVICRPDEIIQWHDTNDHQAFDVCADDHCQRYQGISRIISSAVARAMENTRGAFLVYENEICDARYSKACGGRTEIFPVAWENINVPYLQSISDDKRESSPVNTEEEAGRWITGSPPAYCNTHNEEILRRILPAFDQETPDFYRWQVVTPREELESIIQQKSGIAVGGLQSITPLERGRSGRIIKLRLAGTARKLIIGKELEIRRMLSPSHLLSSAFVVSTKGRRNGLPEKFVFQGAGWGHGVGLCQIGAAVMAEQGYSAPAILAHYFRGAQLKKLY